jgi:hypothetical protein
VISRILTRLAIVWLAGVGGLLLTVAVANGTLAQADWSVVGALVLGPSAIAFALAWVFAPRS